MDTPRIIAPRPIQCVYAKHTGMDAWFLRVYVFTSNELDSPKCNAVSNPYQYCQGMVYIGDHPGPSDGITGHDGCVEDFLNDPRWPAGCDYCHQQFAQGPVAPQRQVFKDPVLRTDFGEQRTLREWMKVPGAMWDAPYMRNAKMWCGLDGLALHVVCPCLTVWHIDGTASNCTDHDSAVKGLHKCWPRKGTPPNIDVGKAYSPTCSAGAGSIQTDYWHGFLQDGLLVDNRK